MGCLSSLDLLLHDELAADGAARAQEISETRRDDANASASSGCWRCQILLIHL